MSGTPTSTRLPRSTGPVPVKTMWTRLRVGPGLVLTSTSRRTLETEIRSYGCWGVEVYPDGPWGDRGTPRRTLRQRYFYENRSSCPRSLHLYRTVSRVIIKRDSTKRNPQWKTVINQSNNSTLNLSTYILCLIFFDNEILVSTLLSRDNPLSPGDL